MFKIKYTGNNLGLFNRLVKMIIPNSKTNNVKDTNNKISIEVITDTCHKKVLSNLYHILSYMDEGEILLLEKDQVKEVFIKRYLESEKGKSSSAEEYIMRNIENKNFEEINNYLLEIAKNIQINNHLLVSSTNFLYKCFINIAKRINNQNDIEIMMFLDYNIRNLNNINNADLYFKSIIISCEQKTKIKDKK